MVEKSILQPREYLEAALQLRQQREQYERDFEARRSHNGQPDKAESSVHDEFDSLDDNADTEIDSDNVSLD